MREHLVLPKFALCVVKHEVIQKMAHRIHSLNLRSVTIENHATDFCQSRGM